MGQYDEELRALQEKLPRKPHLEGLLNELYAQRQELVSSHLDETVLHTTL